MRLLFFFISLTFASCAPPDRQQVAEKTSIVTEERRAEITSERFDACTLENPEETWVFWNNVLSDEDKEKVKSTSYSNLIQFHHGWGTGIRNGFCLWKGGPLESWLYENGVTHPDSMSQYLIELYWSHLNECDPQVNAFAQSDYPGNSDLLHCPSNLDLSLPDYMKEGIETESE